MLAKLTPALIAAFMMTACSASSPEDPVVDLAPDGGVEQTPDSVSLDVDPVDMQTAWNRVVIRGTGPSQGKLFVTSPAFGDDEAQLSSTGEFCTEVDLLDGENTIKLEARDAAGNASEPVYVNVTRAGEPPTIEPPDSGGSTTVKDRTAGSVFYASDDGGDEVSLDSGAWADMIDNNPGSITVFSGYGFHNETVAFKLPKAMTVRKFEVTAPPKGGDTCGPDAFDVYIANAPNPEMAFDGVAWVKVATLSSDDSLDEGGTYELPVIPATATHFAIIGRNASCGYVSNQYGIADIHVLADDDGTPPPPAIDCQNGPPSCACGN